MAQWLERGALPMSLPAVQCRIPLGAGFSERYHVSSLSILGHCKDVVSLGKALHPGRTEMTMCTISSMRRNGCRTVCSPWKSNGTQMNRSSDQRVKM